MSAFKNINDLNSEVLAGNIMNAFDKFYHEEIVMQENSDEPRIGKTINREYEQGFVYMVKEWHNAEVLSVTSNEETNTSMTEWLFDFTTVGGDRMARKQVAVQQWADGQIISEKFYY